ncbi:hypothetical protein HK101_001666, partial [Irineochytrium annulatum]
FHAWQSALVSISLGVATFFISFISSWLAWLLLIIQIGAAGWLGYNAYVNADTLDRYEAPYFGRIASTWVDNE